MAFTRAVELDSTGAALNEYGCFLWHTGYTNEAVVQFQRLLALADQRASAALRSVACNNLAVAFRESGDRVSAAAWQQRSWKTAAAQPAAASGELGCDLGNRGNDAILAGDYELAEQLLQCSLAWETSFGTPGGAGTDWAGLGIVAALRGDWFAAFGRFRRALRLHDAAGDERGSGCDWLHLGQIWAELGRWRPALRCLNRAVRRLELAGATRPAMSARLALADVQRRALLAAFNPSLN